MTEKNTPTEAAAEGAAGQIPEAPRFETLVCEDLAEQFEGRSITYGLLSRLFEKEVDEALLDALCQTRFPANTGDRDMDEAYRMLHAYLCERWERTEEDLRVDYARTFFGNSMTGNAAAYPFESVHTSSERLMMQDARDEVLALYRAAGLEKDESMKDGEDHVALELNYEKIVGDRCAAALRHGDEGTAVGWAIKGYTFLIDHLANWIPLFADEVAAHAETNFYQAAGILVRAFVAEDRRFLEEVLRDCGISPKSLANDWS